MNKLTIEQVQLEINRTRLELLLQFQALDNAILQLQLETYYLSVYFHP